MSLHIEKLEKIILGVCPETQNLRLFGHAGFTNPFPGQPIHELYKAVEGVGKLYTMADIKHTSYARGLPVIVYEKTGQFDRAPENQTRLFD